MQPTCTVLVYNNPQVRGELWNPMKGERAELEGYPSVRVEVAHLPEATRAQMSLTVEQTDGRTLLADDTTQEVEDGAAAWVVRPDQPLASPARAKVLVTQADRPWQFSQEIRLHRLFGRITDFTGRPLAAYVCANGHRGCIAQAAPDGAYEVWLPETYFPAFFVADADYAQTSLEAWVYDYRPAADLHLDLRIGQLELYELHAWRGYSGLKVDFIPQSIGLGNRVLRALGEGEGEERGRALLHAMFGLPDNKPFLMKQDITADLDGTPLTIEGFWERAEPLEGVARDLVAGGADLALSRPEYTLQLTDAPTSGGADETQVLRVVVTRKHVEGEAVVTECGEGYYLGLRSGWGVSGRG